jgi:hypothetical protein
VSSPDKDLVALVREVVLALESVLDHQDRIGHDS